MCARSEALPAVSPAQARCKCCGAAAALYGVVDFHKNCAEPKRKVLELSGIPIYYHRCPRCSFIFTTAFDAFGREDFKRHVYNENYALVDPDYLEVRPKSNAQLVQQLFGASQSLRILDYGGGNGTLMNLLRQAGFSGAQTHDPFVDQYAAKPQDRFECLLCFEVVEHSPTPMATFGEMNSLLAQDGLIVFSTLLQPNNMAQVGLNWWYVGPRNGHVSIFSRQALALVLQQFGFNLGSFSSGLHVAFRKVPAFARHFLRVTPAPAAGGPPAPTPEDSRRIEEVLHEAGENRIRKIGVNERSRAAVG